MISREEIENLAKLARIELGEDEIAMLQKDASNILDYVGQLQDVQNINQQQGKVAPAHRNILRADVPRQEGDTLFHTQAAVLTQLPEREGDYNVVRKIIQKDE